MPRTYRPPKLAMEPTIVDEIVDAFHDEARTRLAPLVADGGGLTHEVTRHEFLSSRRSRRHTYGFWAEYEFETPDLIGTGSYGDRECAVYLIVTPKGRPMRHSLWEWADALWRPDLVPRNTSWVRDVPRMRTIVRGMAEALCILRAGIARADADVVKRLAEARKWRAKEQEERSRKMATAWSIARAGEAFRNAQWETVVELLNDEAEWLSTAQMKKLQIARKRLSDQPR